MLILVSILAFVCPVLIGQLSQMVGRKKMFLISGVITLAVVPVSYHILARTQSFSAILFLTILISCVGNMPYAPVLIFLNERFPVEVRASGTAVSWNVGFAIGGMMPAIVTAVSPTITLIPSRLILFGVVLSVLFLVGSAITSETKGNFS